MGPTSPPIELSPKALQWRFNAGNFVSRALRDGYTCCVRSAADCLSPHEPSGTKSFVFGFLTPAGQLAFLAHCYLRPDGALGASGFLDPKYLIDDDGSHYYVP